MFAWSAIFLCVCLLVNYIFHCIFCITDLFMTSNSDSQFALKNYCISQRILTILGQLQCCPYTDKFGPCGRAIIYLVQYHVYVLQHNLILSVVYLLYIFLIMRNKLILCNTKHSRTITCVQ